MEVWLLEVGKLQEEQVCAGFTHLSVFQPHL